MAFSLLQPPGITATAWLLPGVVHGGEGEERRSGHLFCTGCLLDVFEWLEVFTGTKTKTNK